MGQIFGLGGFREPDDLQRTAGLMAGAVRRAHQPAARLWFDLALGFGLGCIAERDAAACPPGGPTASSVPCVVDGVFYRGPLARSPAPESSLLADFEKDGAASLDQLDGSFAMALCELSTRRLVVASDRFSTRALYWAEFGGRFVFASELKALLAVPGFPLELDHPALVQCAAFGRILGSDTIVRRVSRLSSATMLQWDEESGARVRRYWSLDDAIAVRRPLTPDSSRDIVEAFKESVGLRCSATPLGVSLSGGLDSRSIAAVLAADRIPATSCTTGFPGSADQRLAAQIAHVARTDHHFLELTREAIADYPQALRTAAFVKDELLLFGGFPGRLTEQFCATFGIRTLLRGHGGENLKLAEAWPFQVTPAVLQMRHPGDLVPHLRRVLWSCPPDIDLDRLLPGSLPASRAVDAALDQAVGTHTSLSAAEVMSALYLTQNDGREVPLTRNGLRGLAEMALPFIDYSLLNLVLTTRVEDRCGAGLHIAIMRSLAPALLRIGNSNTGAPVDASPLRLYLTDKVNTILRRLRVPGFRHYHYMDEWLQGFLAEQVRSIVLDGRTLGRGVFPQAYLTDVVTRARGERGFSRLVNFVMNVEIWCRLFIDGEVDAVRV
jgi:asparagine synthase (glutamine-hydrolysing)